MSKLLFGDNSMTRLKNQRFVWFFSRPCQMPTHRVSQAASQAGALEILFQELI